MRENHDGARRDVTPASERVVSPRSGRLRQQGSREAPARVFGAGWRSVQSETERADPTSSEQGNGPDSRSAAVDGVRGGNEQPESGAADRIPVRRDQLRP